ncbi:MAG: hypothetical protein JWM33_2385 [Caulobacteraceae bacterium]|nr:hypothetical protein [Caulobacteraceae bacterium]
MSIFADFSDLAPPERAEIVGVGGILRGVVMAMFAGDTIIVEDEKADIRIGDELRRRLPNGNDDVFVVTDPRFYNDPEFGAHYQVKVRRAGTHTPHQGGNFTINVTGSNARANINSTDNSVNVVNEGVLEDIERAIEKGVADIQSRAAMLNSVAEMRDAKDKFSFLKAYQSLMSSAGDHITVLTPFLPALTAMLGGS